MSEALTPPTPEPAPAAAPPSVEAAPPASGAPPAEAPPTDADQWRDLMGFDPFQPEPAAAANTSPAEPAPAEAPPPTPAAAPLAELSTMHKELLERLDVEPAPKPAGEGQPAPPENPFKDVKVPDQIIAAIYSEDPADRMVGINSLVIGAATMAYNRFQSEMTAFVQQGLPAYFERHAAVVQETKTIESDFYGTYKQFDKPELRPIVSSVAKTMMQELEAKGTPLKSWNAEFRDAVAARIVALAQASAPAAPAPAPAAPGHFTPAPSARPAAGPANEWADLL